eukprot:6477848-Lingulodinium_polyedra.AAC.1
MGPGIVGAALAAGPVPAPSASSLRLFVQDRPWRDIGLYLWNLHAVGMPQTVAVGHATYRA